MNHLDKCREWALSRRAKKPLNPTTKRAIKVGGPTFKKLDVECSTATSSRGGPSPAKDDAVDMNTVCVEWLKSNHHDLYLELAKQAPARSRPAATASLPPVMSLPPIMSPIAGSVDDQEQPDYYYTVETRLELSYKIIDYFKDVGKMVKDGETCMTGNKSLAKHLTKYDFIGFGSYGNVYKASLPASAGLAKPYDDNISVAVKEGKLSVYEFSKAMVKRYPLEYMFNKLINDLITDKICPNFSYTHAIFFCKKCSLFTFDNTYVTKMCSETVVELFDNTLTVAGGSSEETILSLFFQLMFALASIQLEYGMFHNDIKKENVLLKTVAAGGHWEYIVNDVSYYVPNRGWIACLNDFGVSYVYREGVSDRDYGRRQFKVERVNRKWVMTPFNTRAYLTLNKEGQLVESKPSFLDSAKKKLTLNHFYKNFDSRPTIPVDLKDMAAFPVLDFHIDVVNLVYSFVGGKRTSQSGTHPSLTTSQRVIDLFKSFYKLDFNSEMPTDRPDLFLANHAIRKHFKFYTAPPTDQYYASKIETYRLRY